MKNKSEKAFIKYCENEHGLSNQIASLLYTVMKDHEVGVHDWNLAGDYEVIGHFLKEEKITLSTVELGALIKRYNEIQQIEAQRLLDKKLIRNGMSGLRLYPIVYAVVRRAQNNISHAAELQQFEKYFAWSLRIPEPEKITLELANALCTSVSQSAGVGLEIFCQQTVFVQDLLNCGFEDFTSNNQNDEEFCTLLHLIRIYYDGPLVLGEDEINLLKTI